MIEGLANLLEGTEQAGVSELSAVLQQLIGERHYRLVDQVPLQGNDCRVFRLVFQAEGHSKSFVVKKHKPGIAQRNEAVVRRWLPAAKLEWGSPRLLGVAAERAGTWVWHVYEDLGPWALDPRSPSKEKVTAAIDLISRLHTAFVGHRLLAEARLEGGDLGFTFFVTSVRDAIRCLESLDAPVVGVSSDRLRLRDSLLARMHELLQQKGWRARLLEAHGGPETLLHGDLWTCNAFVRPAAGSYRAALIDWDHAAVGPISYDLSTFLLRFPSQYRRCILELYRGAVALAGWALPATEHLNQLFETAELSRLANSIIWPALDAVRDPMSWGWDRLADIEQWFEQLGPVLAPEMPGCDLPLERSPEAVELPDLSMKGAQCP